MLSQVAQTCSLVVMQSGPAYWSLPGWLKNHVTMAGEFSRKVSNTLEIVKFMNKSTKMRQAQCAGCQSFRTFS